MALTFLIRLLIATAIGDKNLVLYYFTLIGKNIDRTIAIKKII